MPIKAYDLARGTDKLMKLMKWMKLIPSLLMRVSLKFVSWRLSSSKELLFWNLDRQMLLRTGRIWSLGIDYPATWSWRIHQDVSHLMEYSETTTARQHTRIKSSDQTLGLRCCRPWRVRVTKEWWNMSKFFPTHSMLRSVAGLHAACLEQPSRHRLAAFLKVSGLEISKKNVRKEMCRI